MIRASIVVVVAALTLTTACTGQQPAAKPARQHVPAPRAASAAARAVVTGRAGTYQVAERQLTFIEPPYAGSAGQRLGRRTLLTEIRYPRARGPFPLLMFAPGFMQCGGPYSDLLEAWASAGYVVAVVDFPRTDCRVGAAAYEPDLVNQPRDMSYVLSRLLAQSSRPDGRFPGY